MENNKNIKSAFEKFSEACEELQKEISREKLRARLEIESAKVEKSINGIDNMEEYPSRLFGAAKPNYENMPRVKSELKLLKDDEKEIFLESLDLDIKDKIYLTREEINLYVDLASERVNLYQAKKYHKELQNLLNEETYSGDGKIQYTLIEAIDRQIQNRDRIVNRVWKLMKEIGGRIQNRRDSQK